MLATDTILARGVHYGERNESSASGETATPASALSQPDYRGCLRRRGNWAVVLTRHADDLRNQLFVRRLPRARIIFEPDADVAAALNRQLGQRGGDVATEDTDHPRQLRTVEHGQIRVETLLRGRQTEWQTRATEVQLNLRRHQTTRSMIRQSHPQEARLEDRDMRPDAAPATNVGHVTHIGEGILIDEVDRRGQPITVERSEAHRAGINQRHAQHAGVGQFLDVRVALADAGVRSTAAHRGIEHRMRMALVNLRPRLTIRRARMSRLEQTFVVVMMHDRGAGSDARTRAVDDFRHGARHVRIHGMRRRAVDRRFDDERLHTSPAHSKPGGASKPPMTSASRRAKSMGVRSSRYGPTIWTPTRSPSRARPTGATVAGKYAIPPKPAHTI